jgi:hypothetical protein
MALGWYAVLISPVWNETVGYQITISGAIPNPSLMLVGVVALAAGVVIIILDKVLQARKRTRAETSTRLSAPSGKTRQRQG